MVIERISTFEDISILLPDVILNTSKASRISIIVP